MSSMLSSFLAQYYPNHPSLSSCEPVVTPEKNNSPSPSKHSEQKSRDVFARIHSDSSSSSSSSSFNEYADKTSIASPSELSAIDHSIEAVSLVTLQTGSKSTPKRDRPAPRYREPRIKRAASTRDRTTLQQTTKRSRTAVTKREKTLFEKCASIFRTIDPKNPILNTKQCNSLTELLEIERGVWIKSSVANKEPTNESEVNDNLVARSEAAIYLARHYSAQCKRDSHALIRTALKYHKIACERLGRGKYDVRGDAFYNYGKFLKKSSDIEKLRKAAKCFKAAAKATSYWSYETSKKSAYSKAESIYRILSVKYASMNDDSESKKCQEKADKCAENAFKNMFEMKKLDKYTRRTAAVNKFYEQSKVHLDKLKRQGFGCEETGKEQIAETCKILGNPKEIWLHGDAEETKRRLQTRSELAYLLAQHYTLDESVESDALAVQYFEMAVEKCSIAKYDVNKKACRAYADYLKAKNGIADLEKAARLYEIAAKATDLSSIEPEYTVSPYIEATNIYIKLLQETSDKSLKEHYSKSAFKCAQNSLDGNFENEPQLQPASDLEFVTSTHAASSTEAATSVQETSNIQKKPARKPLGIISQNTFHEISTTDDFDMVPPLELDDFFADMPPLRISKFIAKENLVSTRLEPVSAFKSLKKTEISRDDENKSPTEISRKVLKFKKKLHFEIKNRGFGLLDKCSREVFGESRTLYKYLRLSARPEQTTLNKIAKIAGIPQENVQFKYAIKDDENKSPNEN